MKRIILSTFLGLSLLLSCEKKHENPDLHNHSNEQINHDLSESHTDNVPDEHSFATSKIELDNGKKWKTNVEMHPFILEQEQLLDEFESDKDDYKKLATDLKASNDKLIKSCTMKGKSHDVLHVWLTDHMKLMDDLSKTESPKEAERIVGHLEDSMENFHIYFE